MSAKRRFAVFAVLIIVVFCNTRVRSPSMRPVRCQTERRMTHVRFRIKLDAETHASNTRVTEYYDYEYSEDSERPLRTHRFFGFFIVLAFF